MGYIEGTHNYGATAISSSTADTVSTNVFNAGSAKKLFAGEPGVKVKGQIAITAGTSPTARARLVGADNAVLSTNPVILADTGVQSFDEDGTALASGDTVRFQLTPSDQRVAKQYYGVIYTLGGTTPSANCDARMAIDTQTNMQGPKAATP